MRLHLNVKGFTHSSDQDSVRNGLSASSSFDLDAVWMSAYYAVLKASLTIPEMTAGRSEEDKEAEIYQVVFQTCH